MPDHIAVLQNDERSVLTCDLPLKDIALSRNQLIVLSSNGCLFGATNEQVSKNNLAKLSPCEDFVAITSSNSHSLALSQEYEEPFEQKTPE